MNFKATCTDSQPEPIDSLSSKQTPLRYDWNYAEVLSLLKQPLMDLVFNAQKIHRQFFDANAVQTSTLLSIKTGACPEDCKYCPQSGHYNTGLTKEKLLQVDKVIEKARKAKASGASRFCMGAAWKHPNAKDWPYVLRMVTTVKALGLETCMTLGSLTAIQADELADAGLDYYNHNLDTSPEYYSQIITTRSFQDRLDTLDNVRQSGMKVCAGGILGMGESLEDRAGLLVSLANLCPHPDSVPINQLVAVAGTPLEAAKPLDSFDFIRVIAVARMMMPSSYVRLSAGRESMSDELQAMAFLAGANSIFYGEKLLTTSNPEAERDQQLLDRLGMRAESLRVSDSSSEASQISEQASQLSKSTVHEPAVAVQEPFSQTRSQRLFYDACAR